MRGLAPSIIAADFTRLGAELARVEPHAIRWHVDVMDGHYVPNLTIGPMICAAVARASGLPQDVHLMISNPAETWEWYAEAGAARIAFHPDATTDPGALLRRLREAGLGAGLAVNPDVPADTMKGFLDDVDHLVVMSVYPGFSGQRFIPDALSKVRLFRAWVTEHDSDIDIIVDGGVNLETANDCVEAGANILVSASAVFGADDPTDVARRLADRLDLP